jgi:hypothetical protein
MEQTNSALTVTTTGARQCQIKKPVDPQQSENTACRSIVIEQLDRTVFVSETEKLTGHTKACRVSPACV